MDNDKPAKMEQERAASKADAEQPTPTSPVSEVKSSSLPSRPEVNESTSSKGGKVIPPRNLPAAASQPAPKRRRGKRAGQHVEWYTAYHKLQRMFT